jgi:mutator protein MutT
MHSPPSRLPDLPDATDLCLLPVDAGSEFSEPDGAIETLHQGREQLVREIAPEVEVAAGLIIKDGKVLITQRRNGAHLGGLWEFPGGKRQPGESFEACLTREVMEELGLAIAVHEQVASAEHVDTERRVRLRFYRCTILSGEPRPLGCKACRWVTPAEICIYPFPPADDPLVRRIASGEIGLSATGGVVDPGFS